MPVSALPPGRSSVEDCPVFVCTPSKRQLECLRLAAQGQADKVIARRLGIKPRTVRAHMRAAKQQLGARDRTHAVVIALARRLISLETIL